MNAPERVLIIDDDEELGRLLTSFLSRFGFASTAVSRPSAALPILRNEPIALVVLDVMLPERDGFAICREIRGFSEVPIIMLTARGDLDDRIVGLELGADDYLAKPFEPRELVARAHTILRRTRERPASPSPIKKVRSGELVVDFERETAALSGRELDLTPAEFAILKCFLESAGRTLSREEIFQNLRGGSWDSVDRSVDVVVSRLRHKLGDDSKHPLYLKTMWGEGYRFVGETSEVKPRA